MRSGLEPSSSPLVIPSPGKWLLALAVVVPLFTTCTSVDERLPAGGLGSVSQALSCAGGTSIDQHAAQCDGSGKLLSWAPVSSHDQAYAYVLGLNQGYFSTLPTITLSTADGDSSANLQKPPYFGVSYLCSGTAPGCSPAGAPVGWPHNPAGLYAMGVDAALPYSTFLGNTAPINLVLGLLDWHLAHGLTSATDSWAKVPYASGQQFVYNYRGADTGTLGVGDGIGYLQPEKVGALGKAFLDAYRYNGNTAYRDAAIQAGNMLASHLRAPTATVSPWPYRVRASDNVVRSGANIVDNFASNAIEPIGLLNDLIVLGAAGALAGAPGYSAANQNAWQSAKGTALGWLLGSSGPIAIGSWYQYFEDVGSGSTDNLNQLVPMETAKWLLRHPDQDPSWQAHVQTLIAFVESNFGDPLEFGARPIREQFAFAYKMGSHTSRYAAVNALYAEATGDATARDKAFRAFNWASYMVRNSGLTLDGPYPANVWFTDSWFDFQRNFLIGLGAVPDWAPAGQSHLLRSSSVVKSVSYAASSVSYQTAEARSTEVLRLAFTPSTVTAGGVALPQGVELTTTQGWTFSTNADQFGNPLRVLRIRHDTSGAVVISGTTTAPQVVFVAPTAGQNFAAPATLSLAATGSASSGRTITSVVFKAGTTALCTVSNPTGTSVSCTGGSALADGSFTVTAQVTDSAGESSLASVGITVSAAPTVSVSSPGAGSTIPAGATTLRATVAAGTGRSIARVEFFQGTTSLCFTTSGSACNWSAAPGSYTVFARATDTGAPARSTDSAAVSFTVSTAAGGTRLVGNDVLGAQNDYDSGGTVNAFSYTAIASGSLGGFKVYAATGNANPNLSVGLYSDSGGNPAALLASCTASIADPLPLVAGAWYGCTVSSPVTVTAGGVYWLALMGQNGGGVYRYLDSATGTMRYSGTGNAALPSPFGAASSYGPASNAAVYGVSAGAATPPPSVSIVSPVSGANFTAPANLSVQATAAAASGHTLSKVEVRDGATVLCTINAPATSDVSCATSALQDGSHSLTAVAVDDLLQSTTSTAVVIAVARPPTVAITAPVNGATFTAGANLTLTATASPGTGRNIVQVQFFAGATLLCSASVSPFSCTWSAVPAGTYALTARATDNGVPAAASTSVVVNVSVGAAPSPPAAPSGLSASAVSSSQVNLSWVDNATNETGFELQRAPDAAGVPGTWALIASPPANATTVSSTGLSASTTFWFRVRAVNGGGASAYTPAVSATTLAAPAVLVGNNTVLTTADFENAGVAAAFSYVATTSGSATVLRLFVDTSTTSTSLRFGLYANGASGPGSLLASCSVTAVTKNAWNACTVPAVAVTAGTTYWLAVLSPSGNGNISWRQNSSTGSYRVQPGLSALPASWSGASGYPGSNQSAYAGN